MSKEEKMEIQEPSRKRKKLIPGIITLRSKNFEIEFHKHFLIKESSYFKNILELINVYDNQDGDDNDKKVITVDEDQYCLEQFFNIIYENKINKSIPCCMLKKLLVLTHKWECERIFKIFFDLYLTKIDKSTPNIEEYLEILPIEIISTNGQYMRRFAMNFSKLKKCHKYLKYFQNNVKFTTYFLEQMLLEYPDGLARPFWK